MGLITLFGLVLTVYTAQETDDGRMAPVITKGVNVASGRNMTSVELPPVALSDTELSIIDRLDAVVRFRPDACAAHFGNTELTWAELDQRSNALALRLHAELGAGTEPVAIVTATGPDMVIAPVAILKSGRPYTWIDASLPLPRAQQILSLSKAQSAVVGTLSSELNVALTSAGLSLHSVGTYRASERPSVLRGGTDPASVVFTSGSTGTPKGVVASHQYCIFHAATCTERGFGPNDRVAARYSDELCLWCDRLLANDVAGCDHLSS